MILPIVAYGDAVLKKKADSIDENSKKLQQLIDDMFETMYKAEGVGLAAPQVGKDIRLFIIDSTPMDDEYTDMKKVFINPEIVDYAGSPFPFEEGCLSIPGIREKVKRPETITIQYLDRNFKEHTEDFSGMAARVIQHEFDHIEGILFTDKLSPLKKKLLKKKLEMIAKGEVKASYPMKFPLKKGR